MQCQEWNEFLDNLADIRVKTEEITSANQSYRKMDIYLTDSEKYGICIENKPYAKDQKDQLSDYYQELKNRKHSCKHLVYLSQNLPSDDSVKSEDLEQWQIDNEFSHIRYNDLVDWLNACKSDCQNASVLEFINQFIKFIQKRFMGLSDMSEQNAIMNAMLESNESIVSAIKIAGQFPELQKHLIQKLNRELTERIKQHQDYDLFENKPIDLSSKAKSGFCIEIQGHNLLIAFQFYGSNYSNFFAGYKPIDELLISGNPIFDEVSNQIITSFNIEKDSKWLGWYWLNNFRSWNDNADIWMQILDGSLADLIMKEIDELYENIVKNKIKIEP